MMTTMAYATGMAGTAAAGMMPRQVPSDRQARSGTADGPWGAAVAGRPPGSARHSCSVIGAGGPPAPPDPTTTTVYHRRPTEATRAKVACGPCAAAKARCDHDRPCSRCRRRRLPSSVCVDRPVRLHCTTRRQPRRPDAIKACAPCQLAHVACSDERPCPRCIRLKQPDKCTITPSRDGRKRRSPTKADPEDDDDDDDDDDEEGDHDHHHETMAMAPMVSDHDGATTPTTTTASVSGSSHGSPLLCDLDIDVPMSPFPEFDMSLLERHLVMAPSGIGLLAGDDERFG
ncbi:Zn(2)-C6 fungal-type domain-containing protein [Plasmodiophora brassicae]